MLAAVGLVAVVAKLSEQQLGVIVYKAGLVTIAAVISYWLDRSLFVESAEPRVTHDCRDVYAAMRIIARALVYLGTVLGFTLGL